MDDEKKRVDDSAPHVPLSRREWLLSLGSAIVLAGSSGAPAEAARGAGQAVTAEAALPPGLYLPSFDHMTHALTRDEPFVDIPQGAETEYVQPRAGPFRPDFFSPQEFRVVRRLIEIILGEDLKNPEAKPVPGAPGSIYDEVAEWIDRVVARAPAVRALALALPADQRALAVAYFGDEAPVRALETFEPEPICREGLAWLGEESRRRIAKDFPDAPPSEQIELVRAVSDARADQSATNAGTRLFDFIKAEAIRGFYTSRLGLKELEYTGNFFYVESPGCGLTPHPPETPGEPK